MDNNLGFALVLMLTIQFVLFGAQMAMSTPESEGGFGSTNSFYHCNGTLLGTYDKNNCVEGTTPTLLANNDPASLLPDNPQGSTNFFVDIFTSIKKFFQSIPGVSFLTNLLGAPAIILNAVIPTELAAITWGLCAIWYGALTLLIFAFIWGR
jgi:hypothetical protein